MKALFLTPIEENKKQQFLDTGIECIFKEKKSVTKEDFKHIDWYFENNPESALRGIVLYCGQAVRNFGEKYTAVPMAKLWRAD